jgi:hypothetical protein
MLSNVWATETQLHTVPRTQITAAEQQELNKYIYYDRHMYTRNITLWHTIQKKKTTSLKTLQMYN